MPRFAANLTLMFTELPFLDRFDAAAKAGFTAVEFLFPYDHQADEIRERLHRNGLTQALFNLPPGNWEAGEKGFASLPDRFADLQAEPAHRAALCAGDRRQAAASDGRHREPQRSVGGRGISQVGAMGRRIPAPHGLDVVIEPINPRNVPGYFLNDFGFAAT